MAKKKKPSQNLAATLTYNKAIYGLTEGVITRKYIASQYTKLRNKMLSQIADINKSKYAFRRSENIPSVPTWKEIRKKSNEDIAHALADINYVIKNETIDKRKANAEAILEGMKRILPFATAKNLEEYADFFEWFRENAISQFFDSTGTVVNAFLKSRAESAMPSSQYSWGRIFVKWLKENKHEAEAQKVGASLFASYRK